ncbi:MAG: HNH endonuclease [Acidobacteria bacterium]|nr:MAG: HNH endonuclease [Acidobacteriota bacterium]
MADLLDHQVRLAAFDWLTSQINVHGDVLPRQLLQEGFEFRGYRIPLVSPQGIFKPRLLDLPLTIATVHSGPYPDLFTADGRLLYRYRGLDPVHRDNVGLRQVMVKRLPLIYFFGIAEGKYMAVWPVYVVGDDAATLTFSIQVDAPEFTKIGVETAADATCIVAEDEGRRSYITSSTRVRLHQRSFRERILHAYREQCALCRLRHRELLDAAHIIPDADPLGEPLIKNGLSLCKLHHAAFDQHFLAVNPDYVIEVRSDILEESDGPMLLHGLQGMHEKRIILPTSLAFRPDRDLLALRYETFKRAS